MPPILEQPVSHEQTADERAIRDIITRAEAAWNKGDAAGFCAEMCDDIDFINVRGEHHHGRQAVEHGHRMIFDTIYKGSRVRFEVEGIRFLRSDVAIAFARAHLIAKVSVGAVVAAGTQAKPADEMQESEARPTMVFAKDDGHWHMVAFHNTHIAPIQTARV
jgi:uncharacterized protein (TIGR02246 family)